MTVGSGSNLFQRQQNKCFRSLGSERAGKTLQCIVELTYERDKNRLQLNILMDGKAACFPDLGILGK